jgi:branched-chain amino acid aminotransferase
VPGSQAFTPDPRNDASLVYLNGELVPRAEAKVSVFDAGFTVGDGVWEGVRLHRGALLFLDEHLERLYAGAARIKLELGLAPDALAAELWRTLDANQMHDGVHLRVMVTRGEKTTVNQDPRNALREPTIVVVAEYKSPDAGIRAHGLELATSAIRCSPDAMFDMRLNSHSRLNLILALLEAIDAGADEALLLDPHDHVSTCNATNFFCVRDGVVSTSTGEYCFNGITRANVLSLCAKNDVPHRVADFTLEDAYDADEAFVTGTFGGVVPVRTIDGRPLRTTPGPLTQRLAALYETLKDGYAREHAR